MTATDLLEQAKQGDAGAISSLMNKALEAKGIKVQASIKDDSVTVTAEAQELPEQSFMVDYVSKCISKLNLSRIKFIYIRGQLTGSKYPAWRQTIDLKDNKVLQIPAINKSTSSTNSKSQLGQVSIFNILVQFREIINTTLLGAILAVLAFNLWWQRQPKNVQYEYKIESLEDVVFDTSINRLGDEGWELVFARRALAGEEYSRRGIYECIFRRVKVKESNQQ
ncbi:hypothetical protein [Anabaena azotica]|uniref:DUF4177 domain-containing protein n=1 Tax=Anabaena azotica FACHB-119 TaxID=947527 RepID=A0ABR8DD80_9NOST|nr:hypothetical protein [Anabaena azotica]MBD2505157.1 hypothetical protein [Anabaena azotica FACHB-119]